MKLVDLNTAKALQELGYDGEYTHCHVGVYVYPKNENQIMTLSECEKYRHDISILCAAPRLDDAAYWLRDNYKLNIVISIAEGDFNYFHLTIEDFSDTKYDGDFVGSYSDPTDALEVGVKRCLEIVKQRIN